MVYKKKKMILEMNQVRKTLAVMKKLDLNFYVYTIVLQYITVLSFVQD